ncbi:MAG: DivIVA domain-containing protein [Fibrobacterota bacterium]
MKITPLDIRRQGFRKGFRGFDADEVTHFLEMVATEMESLVKENQEQKEDLKVVRAELDRLNNLEKTLQDTLVTAQRVAEDSRQSAKRESETLIERAEVKADKMVGEAMARRQDVKNSLIALNAEKENFVARFRALLNSQLETLTALEIDKGLSLDKFSDEDEEAGKPEAAPQKEEVFESDVEAETVMEDDSPDVSGDREEVVEETSDDSEMSETRIIDIDGREELKV